MHVEDAIHADRKTLRNSLFMIGAVLLIGVAVVLIWLNQRIQVTPVEKSQANTNCIAWVDYYTGDKRPVQTCEKALHEDERQFYRRWAGGGSSIPDDHVK
jgi:hypothetical protein